MGTGGGRGTGGRLGLGATGEALERELGPAEWDARVVGAGADGVGPGVLLSARARPREQPGGVSRSARPLAQYLLGCPEGFARMVLEHRARPGGGLRAVVIPSLAPCRSGGLPGLLLRLSSDGHAGVRVLGPPGCPAQVLALRHVARWSHPRTEADVFPSSSAEGSLGTGYEDGLVAVTAALMRCHSTGAGDRTGMGSGVAGAQGGEEPYGRPRKQQRCGTAALPGPGTPESGQAEGTWFQPHEDVPVFLRAGGDSDTVGADWTCPLVWLDLKSLGGAVAMVDCADKEDVAAVRYELAASEVKKNLLAAFHWTEPRVAALPEYGEMCKELEAGAGALNEGRHFMLQRMANARVGFLASRRVTVKLNMLSEELFPLPFHSTQHGEKALETAAGGVIAAMDLLSSGPNLKDIGDGCETGDEPARPAWEGLDELRSRLLSERPDLKDKCNEIQGAMQEAAKKSRAHSLPSQCVAQGSGSNTSAADALRARLLGKSCASAGSPYNVSQSTGVKADEDQKRVSRKACEPDTEAIFLGTGCAEPSKYRSGSGILFRCGSNSTAPGAYAFHILVEAGEGVYGQMVRQFGEAGALQEVGALACVWVSHRHADHCTGLPGIIAARRAARAGSPSLLVVGPWPVRDWLRDSGLLDDTSLVHFVHSRYFNQQSCPARRDLFCRTGLAEWTSIRVQHCYDSYGLVFGHKQGWRVAFSGDCRPSRELMRTGFRCTLLIHEATFEDSLGSHAQRKRHSTSSEAVAASLEMQAHRTVFTHFSQRYPRAPRDVPREGPMERRPIVAFDGMRICLSLLEYAPLVVPGVDSVLEAPGSGN